MPRSWEINAEWEYLDSGLPEERACFAALSIYAHAQCLTEGCDAWANRLRKAPYLSAYPFAEWLAWNWWRLRWEPRAPTPAWAFAHRTANIGGGYIWPDITVFSDGQRMGLIARGTPERPETPFRYLNNAAVAIPATEFETGVDEFLAQVLERLNAAGIAESNLALIWREVQSERHDPGMSRRRTIEALLGCDPDDAAPETLERLLGDAESWGASAVEELAANAGCEGGAAAPPTAVELQDLARRLGFAGAWDEAVGLTSSLSPADRARTPAWRLGARAARALRAQERLGSAPISDAVLAALSGTSADILKPNPSSGARFAFALKPTERASRLVLRSRWNTGRRFELARLLGDRLLADPGDRLFPATRAYTYRQKLQRAFAAELLSPHESVAAMLDGDASEESQQDVASYFQVSDWTIRTLLVNNGILDRNDLDGEQFALAA